MKPMLVGEANPYGADPEFALYPDPSGCAGHRLCHKVMGLDPDDYLARFQRVNLCPSAWSLKVARTKAFGLKVYNIDADVTTVLLGAKVCAAFEVAFVPFTTVGRRARTGQPVYVVLPHPSGLSRAWSKRGAFERARKTLREAGVLS
jgi:hypothetical protein